MSVACNLSLAEPSSPSGGSSRPRSTARCGERRAVFHTGFPLQWVARISRRFFRRRCRVSCTIGRPKKDRTDMRGTLRYGVWARLRVASVATAGSSSGTIICPWSAVPFQLVPIKLSGLCSANASMPSSHVEKRTNAGLA